MGNSREEGRQTGISKIGGKDWRENIQKNLSVLQIQGRRSSIWMFFYGNIYIDTFKADKEISKR